jgi:hypothetical protein
MAIVAVFCAGLGKLWWNNRLMKKQEVLDEEKRARVEEIRKTGLPLKRGNQVPFGVRAIQSGIEVDGIWISRPTSLSGLGEKLASSSTTLGRGEDEKSVLVTTTNLDRTGPKQSPSTASIFQKLTDTDSLESGPSVAGPPVSQFAHSQTKKRPSRPAGALNEDTLRKLEGQSPSRPHYEAYVPASPPRRPNPRNSASSLAESVDSQPRSAGGASGRSFTSSSHSSRLYMARTAHAVAAAGRGGHDLRRWSEKEGRGSGVGGDDPFATPPPARTPSGFSAFSQSDATTAQAPPPPPSVQPVEMTAPEPALGSGNLHFGGASKRAN